MRVHICICYARIYVYMRIYVCVMRVYMYTCYARIYAYVHVCYARIYIHRSTHTHTNIHTHAHTHTQTPPLRANSLAWMLKETYLYAKRDLPYQGRPQSCPPLLCARTRLPAVAPSAPPPPVCVCVTECVLLR